MIRIPETLQDMEWQRMQWITYSKAIPANSNGSDVIQISDDGHFKSYYLGGQYTTLTAQSTDGGACQVSIRIVDNGRRWNILDNLAPMSLFCSPGRQRSSGVAGDPSNPLFYPVEFPYIFLAGTSISIEYANAAAYANTIWLVFYGDKLFKDFSAQTPRNAE